MEQGLTWTKEILLKLLLAATFILKEDQDQHPNNPKIKYKLKLVGNKKLQHKTEE
jgi:hypothetical protein